MTDLNVIPLPVKKTSPPYRSIYFRDYLQEQKTYLAWKRLFDVVFSLLVVIFLLSWLFPVIALLIKLTSRGPVFFVQKRVGFLGKTFKCYKFRTMVLNGEANTRQAVKDDPRITKIGHFLRISSLDELPQFINVLKGQMSIIGPRPHMHQDCNDFSKVVGQYKLRNIAKPGITGLAQVKGCRGPAKDMESVVRRYQWDCYYIRNSNFRLDMRIIGLTVTSTLSTAVKGAKTQKAEEPAIHFSLLTNKN